MAEIWNTLFSPQQFFLRKQRQLLRSVPIFRNYGAQDGLIKVLGLHNAKIVHRGTLRLLLVSLLLTSPDNHLSLACHLLINLISSDESTPFSHLPLLNFLVLVEFMDAFTGLGKLPVENDIKFISYLALVVLIQSYVLPAAYHSSKRIAYWRTWWVSWHHHTRSRTTEWVSRMMVVGKPDGDVRICWTRRNWKSKSRDNTSQCPPSNKSSKNSVRHDIFVTLMLTQVSTKYPYPMQHHTSVQWESPRGRYQYLRLPFELKLAPKYLQTTCDLFSDLPSDFIYFDDFLVTGETQEELHANLELVFLRCRLQNLKLQSNNCRFFLQELPWLNSNVIGQGTQCNTWNAGSRHSSRPRPNSWYGHLSWQILSGSPRTYQTTSWFTESRCFVDLMGASKIGICHIKKRPSFSACFTSP